MREANFKIVCHLNIFYTLNFNVAAKWLLVEKLLSFKVENPASSSSAILDGDQNFTFTFEKTIILGRQSSHCRLFFFVRLPLKVGTKHQLKKADFGCHFLSLV